MPMGVMRMGMVVAGLSVRGVLMVVVSPLVRTMIVIVIVSVPMPGGTFVLMRDNGRRIAGLQIEHGCLVAAASAIRAHQRTSSSSIDLRFSSSPFNHLNRNEP